MAKKYGLFINGQYVHTESYRAVHPAMQPLELLGEFSYYEKGKSDPEILEAALEGLHQSFRQIEEGFFPLHERLAFLERLKGRLSEQRENIASLLSKEVGKPLALARAEVDRGLSTLEWTLLDAPRFLSGERLPSSSREAWASYDAWVLREPRGPLLAITPFNFPLNLVLHKVAPAIAAGCPVLLKPSAKAALTTLCLVDFCQAEGLPAGLLNLVLCDDESTCEMLADPRITQASFTGSEKVGWNLRAKAPTKPLSLELGGAAPAYVDESADLDLAASALAHGALSYSGQTCISVQSIHVHRKVAAAFREKLIAEWGKIAAADPALAEAQVGPVIDAQAADRLESLAARLLADGARVTALGTPVKNGLAANTPYVQPRLFEELSIEDDFYSQECFGPFAALREVESFEQFRDFANQLPARLQTCVFTRDLAQAHAAARGLRYGGVVVNQSANFRMDPMPYGGRGRAGSGREGPLSALREYTEEKSVLIRT